MDKKKCFWPSAELPFNLRPNHIFTHPQQKLRLKTVIRHSWSRTNVSCFIWENIFQVPWFWLQIVHGQNKSPKNNARNNCPEIQQTAWILKMKNKYVRDSKRNRNRFSRGVLEKKGYYIHLSYMTKEWILIFIPFRESFIRVKMLKTPLKLEKHHGCDLFPYATTNCNCSSN